METITEPSDGTADPVVVNSLEEGVAFIDEYGLPVGVWSSFALNWEPQLAETEGELLRLLEAAMDVSPLHEAALSRESK